nr:IS110 family transposase [Bacteroidota bacterium]
MNYKEIIGIDVGKQNNELRIHSNQKNCDFKNTWAGCIKMVKWVLKNTSFEKQEILFVFEHTGIYTYHLTCYLQENEIPFILVPGLAIKRSLGITRGKDDKIDAKKIALYGYRLKDELTPVELPSQDIQNIKNLLSLREQLVKQRAGYKARVGEMKPFLKKKDNKVLFQVQEKMITDFGLQIDKVENEIDSIVKSSKELKRLYGLATSVKGIGAQTALFLMVFTNGFTQFSTWRKFASYCGIAPFPNKSGTSLRGKTKVNNLANKKIKSLLDQCAKSAIQHNQEMKIYYQKRLDEGKSKMSTINIVRNKLLSRAFAAINRGTPYVDLLKYAA